MISNKNLINALFLLSLIFTVSNLNTITKTDSKCKPLENGCIILFERCDFQGQHYVLCNSKMNNIYDHFSSKNIGSIRVGNSTNVYFWDKINFKGNLDTLSTTHSCILKPFSSIMINPSKSDLNQLTTNQSNNTTHNIQLNNKSNYNLTNNSEDNRIIKINNKLSHVYNPKLNINTSNNVTSNKSKNTNKTKHIGKVTKVKITKQKKTNNNSFKKVNNTFTISKESRRINKTNSKIKNIKNKTKKIHSINKTQHISKPILKNKNLTINKTKIVVNISKHIPVLNKTKLIVKIHKNNTKQSQNIKKTNKSKNASIIKKKIQDLKKTKINVTLPNNVTKTFKIINKINTTNVVNVKKNITVPNKIKVNVSVPKDIKIAYRDVKTMNTSNINNNSNKKIIPVLNKKKINVKIPNSIIKASKKVKITNNSNVKKNIPALNKNQVVVSLSKNNSKVNLDINTPKLTVALPKTVSKSVPILNKNQSLSVKISTPNSKEIITKKTIKRKIINWNEDFVLTKVGKGIIQFAVKSEDETQLFLSPNGNSNGEMYEIRIWPSLTNKILVYKQKKGKLSNSPVCQSNIAMKQGLHTFSIFIDQIKSSIVIFQDNTNILNCVDKPFIKSLKYFSFESDNSLYKIRTDNINPSAKNKLQGYKNFNNHIRNYTYPKNTDFIWKNEFSLKKTQAGSITFSTRGNKELLIALSHSIRLRNPSMYFVLGGKENTVSYSVVKGLLINTCISPNPIENTDQLNEYTFKLSPDNKVLIYENNNLIFSCSYSKLPPDIKYFTLGDFSNKVKYYNIQTQSIN